jgi:pilus assembly protein CpaB
MKLPILSTVKPSKTWIILGVSIVIGVAAALVARGYLSGRMAEIERSAKGRTTGVVVAKKDMPKGTRLSSENAAIRMIPVDFAHSNAITPEEFDRVDGQALAYPVKSGEMILRGVLEGKKAPTFSARVQDGHRAITVPVDEINSISGMLEPGDIVDLMITVEQKGQKITFPLLQTVPVMATGQRSIDDPKTGERRSYNTVTLDTSPEAAQNIIIAREVGKITALLRNPQDKQPIPNAYGDLAALLRTKDNGAPLAQRKVPVLYGGSGGKGLEAGLNMAGPTTPEPIDRMYATPYPGAPGAPGASTAASHARGYMPVNIDTRARAE